MSQIPINYIEFSCHNITAIKSFYHTAFGWLFTDYGDGYTAFEDGKLSGGFAKIEDHQRISSGASGPLVILYAEELERSRQKVTEAGGTIVEDIFSFPGGRRFHFKDPDGNILAVWSK